MDSLMHSCHKIMLERAAANSNQRTTPSQTPDVAPPAYSAEPLEDVSSDTDDDEEDALETDPSPVTLTLDAGTNIEGTGNMIATPPLADATRLSTLLLAAVQSLNNSRTRATENASQIPVLRVNLVINCGVTVRGDRNVVGYKTQGVLPAIKRKATDEISEGAPEAKRPKAE